jgi:hypothetical protein
MTSFTKKHLLSFILATNILLLLLVVVGCEDTGLQGDGLSNQAPNTSLTVDEVNRSGDDRLISQIRISWWGDDPDGFIAGYEYRINRNSDWGFTLRNDSTFILPMPEGQDSSDVVFEVRAIDNDGLEDDSPASLVLPIKNSVPSVSFKQLQTPPDTTYTLFGFGWEAFDPDGQQNLLYTEIAFNSTDAEWLRIPVEENFLHFDVNAQGEAAIFLGESFRSSSLTTSGININSENTFYIRVVDQALRTSEIKAFRWYVKNQESRLLILNDDASNDGQQRLASYLEVLSSIGYSYDLWNINDGEANSPISEAFPKTTEPTLLKTVDKWDAIIWFTNDIERNLRFAQNITRDFFDNGGKMLVTGPIKRLGDGDPLLNFIPIASYGVLTGLQTGFVLNNNSAITPVEPTAPTLANRGRINTITPFLEAPGSKAVYTTTFRATTILGSTQPYNGPSTISVLNPEGNFLLFGFEPADVTTNENLSSFFQYLLQEELTIQSDTP